MLVTKPTFKTLFPRFNETFELFEEYETICHIFLFILVYNKVRSKKGGGDSLYVRAMFDHIPEKEGELAFHKDDLLHVEDTMYNGQQGVWYAWLVNDEGKKMKGGTIPSKDR